MLAYSSSERNRGTENLQFYSIAQVFSEAGLQPRLTRRALSQTIAAAAASGCIQEPPSCFPCICSSISEKPSTVQLTYKLFCMQRTPDAVQLCVVAQQVTPRVLGRLGKRSSTGLHSKPVPRQNVLISGLIITCTCKVHIL